MRGQMVNMMKYRRERMEKEMEYVVKHLSVYHSFPSVLGDLVCSFTWDIERVRHENWKDLKWENVEMHIEILPKNSKTEIMDTSPMRKYHMEKREDGFRSYVINTSLSLKYLIQF